MRPLPIMFEHLQLRLLEFKKKPRWFRLLVLFAIGYAYFFVFIGSFVQRSLVEPWEYISMDYPMFYNAARAVIEGHSPYPEGVLHQTPDAGRAWGNYLYPPLFAWVLAPTTVLPILWSKKTYVYSSMILYFLLLTPWRGKTSWDRVERLFVIALLCIWGPAIETFRFGQSNWVPFFLLFFACCLCERQSPGRNPKKIDLLAGGLIGVAGMVKLTPFIILPMLLLAGFWWVIAGMGLGILSTILLTGIRDNCDYFFIVLPTMTDFGERPHFMSLNRGIIEILQHIQHPGHILDPSPAWMVRIGLLANLIVFAYTMIYVFVHREKISLLKVILISCYLAPLLGGSWLHHYTFALLPILIILRMKLRGPLPRLEFLVVLFLILWPNFYFWFPARAIHNFLDSTFGISDELLVSVSNLLVFLLIFPLLVKAPELPRLAWWRKKTLLEESTEGSAL